uniref:Uncharacterized protein n=1 Tax=Anguilla anguilla TaxID=7936 RepID=A0A0E9T4N7_ANGAN
MSNIIKSSYAFEQNVLARKVTKLPTELS